MESLLQLIAGKSADPAAIEAALNAMMDRRIAQALAGEQAIVDRIIDRVNGETIPAISAMLDEKIDRLMGRVPKP